MPLLKDSHNIRLYLQSKKIASNNKYNLKEIFSFIKGEYYII